MLKPAQIYSEELKEKMTQCWYDPRYMYYSGWTGDETLNLPENNYDRHDFVSVDADGNVIGYISYCVNWITMSAYRFGALNFDIGNLTFGKDLYTAICNLFEIYHMNRVEWCVIEDNPIIKTYRRFAEKHGGVQCSRHRQVAKLMDGKLHNSIEFEIMAEDFIK